MINMSEIIFEGPGFKVSRGQIELPSGKIATRDTVVHPGAVAMVPLLPDGQVVLIRQYRYSFDDVIWEVPAGTLEPNETIEACARRELIEEVGYECKSIKKLTHVYPSPGFMNEIIHIYLCEDLVHVGAAQMEDEDIEIEIKTLEEAIEMVKDGVIRDAKTVIGLMLTYQMR